MEKLEHNVSTGEINVVELSEPELKQLEIDAKDRSDKKAKEEQAAQAKVALLERLGITAEEAALLLS